MSNPLLEKHTHPLFHKMTPADAKEAIDALIARNLKNLDGLIQTQGSVTWKDVIEPIEDWEDDLHVAWSPVSHINSVSNTPEWREAYQYCLPKLTDYGTQVGQNEKLYNLYCALKESESFQKYNQAQQAVINHAILDFQLSGVSLAPSDRKKFADLSRELSELQSHFQDNVMDATDAWHYDVVDSKQLSGLPEPTVELAKQAAEKANVKGWRLTLDYPCFSAVMTYADDASVRQALHQGYFTKASEKGIHPEKWDNTQNMNKILSVRHEMAKLLGFKNYAEKSLAKKMAKSPEEVMRFLIDLAEKTKPYAEKEWNELTSFARETYQVERLNPWDVGYYSEKMRQKNYAFSQEMLREYFPADKVLSGLFEVVTRLYGIRVELNADVPVWDPSVQYYDIYNKQGKLCAGFYLDLYARHQKRGGAWMDDARIRHLRSDGTIQLPIAYLTCNFRTPIGDQPSLLTHDEVITLFHEFGHGLHHMLTKIDYSSVSGINGVPWDVVEVPSQFMEHWCWQNEALAFLSSHYQTQEPLSKEWLEKMHRAKNFQSAMSLIRQVEFSLFDFQIHLEFDPKKESEIYSVLNNIRAKYSVTPQVDYNRFAHSFSHIFAGGYAAGYYSYLWAEVMACDAFSKFLEEGIFNPKTGQEFLEKVLEKGGSVEPHDWFKDFRGRSPSIEPFLKEHGLSNS